MAPPGLFCQVCLLDCPTVGHFKEHLRSKAHQQIMAELFQNAVLQWPAHLKNIGILESRPKYPKLGLALVTLCFSSGNGSLFYLCHACEDSFSDISVHLESIEHCRNYYSYTNPDVLRFSWITSSKIHTIVDPMAHSRVKKNWERHTGKLQALDLPLDVFETVERTSYVKAMATLSQNDNLLKQTTAARPKEMTIQTYLGTPKRKHPLLGLEHVVECSSEEQTDRHLYLCTVCKRTLKDHKIISHLLGFNHIRCYINAWHPSTLLDFYDYTSVFNDMMQDFAKQMREIHGTTITDMKQAVLRPALFSSLEGSSYVDALAMLEHWRKIRKESSLITSITPGDRLVHVPGKMTTNNASKGPVSVKESNVATEKTVSARSSDSETENHPVTSCFLSCQVCNMKFNASSQYEYHVRGRKHKQAMETIFGTEADELDYGPVFFSQILNVPQYISQYITDEQRAEPVIGLLHVVTCVSTRAAINRSICLCLVCKWLFPATASKFRQHLRSPSHIQHTLMYQSPAQLPFAWKEWENDQVLKPLAWEEENLRGPDHMVLKIIDLPSRILSTLCNGFPLGFQAVCETLDQNFRNGWTYEVPRIFTLNDLLKTISSDKYPELGLRFLVRHKAGKGPWRSLCLLCERNLDQLELSSHAFSLEHVKAFLTKYHPGSLDCEAQRTPDMLLDFAKRAAAIHSPAHIQKFKLSRSTPSPHTYRDAVMILTKKTKGGQLFPVLPVGEKLVPTETLKEIDSGFGSDTSPDMTKKPERDAATPRHPDVKDPTPRHPDVKDPTPPHPDVKDPTPPHPDVKDPTPQHPDVKDPTRQPVPVEKEAVPEKDSCVHKPDEKTCLTQNTSVERGADEDALEHSTEEPPTEKDQATGSAVKLTGRGLNSESQETARKRKRDAAEEAGTESGATGEDSTTPGAGGDFEVGKESTTHGERQRSEGAVRPEAAGKRQRLCDTEEICDCEKTQKMSEEEQDGAGDGVGQTAEASCAVMAETNARDQCVTHEALLRKEKEFIAEKDTFHGLQPNAPPRPADAPAASQVTHDIQVTPEDADPTATCTDLWRYLNDAARRAPVIGLSMVTEVQCPEEKFRNYFVCDCCCQEVLRGAIVSHITCAKHGYNYIKKAHCHMLDGWSRRKGPKMRDLAQQVERDEGWGRLKVTVMGSHASQSVKPPATIKTEEDLNYDLAVSKTVAELTELSNSCLTERTAQTVSKGNVVTARLHTANWATSNWLAFNKKLELISKLAKSTATVSKPTSVGVASKATSASDKPATTSSPTVAQACGTAATPQNKAASKMSESILKTATNQPVRTTSSVLANNSKLAISSTSKPAAPSHAAIISKATAHLSSATPPMSKSITTTSKPTASMITSKPGKATISSSATVAKSTGTMSHLTQTTSSATPTISRTTATSKPIAHISESTTTISKCTTSTTTSKPSTTVCHSTTVMSKPTAAASSNTNPDISKLGKATSDSWLAFNSKLELNSKLSKVSATISKPSSSVRVSSKPTRASDKPATTSSPTVRGACDIVATPENEVASKTDTNQQVTTTSDVLSTNSKLAVSSETTVTTSKPPAPSHATTISSATRSCTGEVWTWVHGHGWIMSESITTISEPTTSMITSEPSTCPAISESQEALWEAMDAAFIAGCASEATRASGKYTTFSSPTSAISKSAGSMSHLIQTTSSATPTISRTTSNSKPIAYISESTTTISKCTTSTTTSKPNTTVCHSPTVMSKHTAATFSNTTPSDKPATTTSSPTVTGAGDTSASPKNKVASKTSESISRSATNEQVTTTSDVLKATSKAHLKPISSKITATTSKPAAPSHATTISSASSAIYNSTILAMSHLTQTNSSATPTVSRTTANPKPTAHTSSPSTTVCHSTTVMSKPPATFSNTTPAIAKLSKSTGSISKLSQQVTETSVTGTKAHTTSTTCQTNEDCSNIGHMKTYVRANSEDGTQKRDTQLLLSLATAVSPTSSCGSSPSETGESTRRSESTTNEPVVAMAMLEAILRQQRGSQDSPSATNPQPESLKHQDMLTGLHEPSHHADGSKTSQRPGRLAPGSESSSPLHTLSPDIHPDSSPQSSDVWLKRSHYPSTQPAAPRDTRTQPVALRDSVKQRGVSPDSTEWQEAPRDSGIQPWAPQYSGKSLKASHGPGIQPQNPAQRERRSIKLEEAQEPLGCPDSLPVLQPVPQSNSAGKSRVSQFLNVKLSEAERKKVVGLTSVVECQCEISKGERLSPFYMCLCCQERVQLKHICGHIISVDHRRKYMWKESPSLMAGIWNLESLSEEQKIQGFEMSVNIVAEREQFYQRDAEIRLLDKDSYHRLKVAPFNEAIHMLDILKRMEKNLTSPCPPADQQPPEVTDDKHLKKDLTETTPISVAVVKTEPVPEPLSRVLKFYPNPTRPEPTRRFRPERGFKITIKQEVKQEDHAHPCFSGHTGMRNPLKHGLDCVSSIRDAGPVKQRRMSKSHDGGGTSDGPSTLHSNVSSPASPCPSPQNQEDGVKVQTTSVATTVVSQLVQHCEALQMKPEQKLELVLKSLKTFVSSNFKFECPPTELASAASTEQSTTPWFMDSSLAKLESQPVLQSTPSDARQASLPLMLTSVTAVPLSPPANKDLPSSELTTSIVDMNKLKHFGASQAIRAKQSGKEVSPSQESSENAIVGRVKPRMQLDSNVNLRNSCKRAATKPADDDIWNYESRQLTPGKRATDVISDDQSLESYYRAANPASEDSTVTSSPPVAKAVGSMDQTTQLYCNLGISVGEPSATPATVINPDTSQALQASLYNTMVSPFNIGVGPYMGGPVTVVNPNPTSQQFTGFDYTVNWPTVSMVSPSGSLTTAGYGTPVYAYSQVTQNPYFPHGYPSVTGTQNPYFSHGYPSGAGTQNSYLTHGYPHGAGPAGISQALKHPVFSQNVNYTDGSTGGLYPIQTPPQQGTGQAVMFGGPNTTDPTAEVRLDMQIQQQPQ